MLTGRNYSVTNISAQILLTYNRTRFSFESFILGNSGSIQKKKLLF